MDLDRDVESASGLVRGRREIGQRRRVARGPLGRGRAERLEGLQRHHPGRDRGREILGQERAERLVLPALHVAR